VKVVKGDAAREAAAETERIPRLRRRPLAGRTIPAQIGRIRTGLAWFQSHDRIGLRKLGTGPEAAGTIAPDGPTALAAVLETFQAFLTGLTGPGRVRGTGQPGPA
jgi:hypothetical protein